SGTAWGGGGAGSGGAAGGGAPRGGSAERIPAEDMYWSRLIEGKAGPPVAGADPCEPERGPCAGAWPAEPGRGAPWRVWAESGPPPPGRLAANPPPDRAVGAIP